MKKRRQDKILEIIAKKAVQTQEDLLQELRDAGFEVTQATVSRDIKELKLIKSSSTDGKYRYYSQDGGRNAKSGDRLVVLCRQNAISCDYAGNTCVVKCMSGTANAVCAGIDESYSADDSFLGTIAGDDTIFILFRNEAASKKFIEYLKTIISF